MLTAAAAPAQAGLARLFADRVEWVTGSASTGPAQNQPDTSTADTTVLVLLRSFDLAGVVHGARHFAAALSSDEATAWRRSWTRTRFLFGNPANLPPWAGARVIAPGATVAWLGPFPDSHQPGLSRLLKPVTGELPALPGELDLDGGRRVLQIGTGGLSLVDYLVHLHHTLAEAVLLGRLRPDEPLRLSHRPVLTVDPAQTPTAYARVLPEPGDTGRLRLHTWLSADPVRGRAPHTA